MLKLLLKKQFLEIFQVYFYDAKKNKERSKTSTAMYFVLFILLVFGLLGGIFTFLAAKLCMPLIHAGMDWMYFALMGLNAVLLGAFGSVFNTYAGLYLPKDNNMLFAMPIPVAALVESRLIVVYLMGFLHSVVVILPAIIVYWVTAGTVVYRVYASAWMDAWLLRVYELFCGCKSGFICVRISVVTEKGCYTFGGFVIRKIVLAYGKFRGNIQCIIQNSSKRLSCMGISGRNL